MTAPREPSPRRLVFQFIGFSSAAVLWGIGLTDREDVGLVAILVLIGWTSVAVMTGLELLKRRRRSHPPIRDT